MEGNLHLSDFLKFDSIAIQCHDNPDADAIASGYGIYMYLKAKGKKVRLFYSGKKTITKTDTALMVKHLSIPIEYVPVSHKNEKLEGLLVTVDCQYGANNVTRFEAESIAIVDHHIIENDQPELCLIQSNLGSCSTLVWRLLQEENFAVSEELGTALIYGLYTDTSQFAELFNPIDMDAKDSIPYSKSLIKIFKNSKLSIDELEIAGIALLRTCFNQDYKFAVIKSKECDPNILGIIADFLMQVDKVESCIVFFENESGFKFSVRSCVREVNADELARFLAGKIGSGGGHYERAGGFIAKGRYNRAFQNLHAEAYFNNRMIEYFKAFDLIYPERVELDITGMGLYEKTGMPVGFVKTTDVVKKGTPIIIRTIEGDMERIAEDDLYIIIGVKGEVYFNSKDKFERSYRLIERPYVYEENVHDAKYVPTLKDLHSGITYHLSDYAKLCEPTGIVRIYARVLERGVKVFTHWDEEKYMVGRPGDYLAVRADDMRDIYVIEQKIFGITYKEVY